VRTRSFAPARTARRPRRAAGAAAQDAHYWSYGYGPIGQLTEGTLVAGRGSLGRLLQPGRARAHRRAAVPLRPHLDRAREDQGPGRGRPEPRLRQPRLRHRACDRGGHVGENKGRRTTSRSRSCPATIRTGPRLQQRGGLGHLPRRGRGLRSRASARGGVLAGGTWSHRVREGLSFGVSPFVAYRAQRSRRSLTLEDLAAGTSRASSSRRRASTTTCGSSPRPASPGGRAAGRSAPRSRPRACASTMPASRCSTHRSRAAFAADPLREHPKGLDATYRAPWSVAAGRLGAADAPPSMRRSSGSRRWIPTTSSPRTPPPWPEARPPSPGLPGCGQKHRELRRRRRAPPLGSLHALRRRRAQRLDLAAGVGDPRRVDLVDVTGGVSLNRGRSRLAFGLGYAWAPASCPRRWCRRTRRADGDHRGEVQPLDDLARRVVHGAGSRRGSLGEPAARPERSASRPRPPTLERFVEGDALRNLAHGSALSSSR